MSKRKRSPSLSSSEDDSSEPELKKSTNPITTRKPGEPERTHFDRTDYAQGSPRHHTVIYITTGDLVIQAEKAIFKIHRHFLMEHSPVLKDMLKLPRYNGRDEGTDSKPLVLPDKAREWELLLSTFYRKDPMASFEYTWEELVVVLRITHKYRMQSLEDTIVSRLRKANTKDPFMHVLEASRIIDSRDLYKCAIRGLATPRTTLSFGDAERIGLKAFYDITACKSGQFKG